VIRRVLLNDDSLTPFDSYRKLKEELLKFAINAESKPALGKLVSLAKKFPPIADAGDAFDQDPRLTATPQSTVFPAGLLNWRTGEFRRGDPADRITRMLGVAV
jgi:hypothetical protein